VRDGASIFSEDACISELTEKYLENDLFVLVGQIKRFPRYVNKRALDPNVKMFLELEGIHIPEDWLLPQPNPEAAYKSLAKYGKSTFYLDEEMTEDMNLAWGYVSRHFSPYMSGSRVMSLVEAVDKLDMTTSCGAPFNSVYTTKRELFDGDSTIVSWLEGDWERLALDPHWTCLFTNSLKEEIRPVEKVLDNSMRTFLSGAVDATVHGTRLFCDQNEKLYAAHFVTSSAVGMSPYYGEWNRMYRLLSVFEQGFALDESQYDSSLRAYMMWSCARFRWSCLREEDQTSDNYARLRTYYRNIVNTLIVDPEGVLYLKKGGNPSGSVNTITDNTLVLYALMAYAWIRLAPEEFSSYECFEDHTSKFLVGDDNTWTVSDDAIVFYNAKNIIAEWKTLGVTTTTDSLEPRHPADLDFLSAHTTFINGIAVPIYNSEKLLASLCYHKKKKIGPVQSLDRATAMLTVGWTNKRFRSFLRRYISWLIREYDQVMCGDTDWVAARSRAFPDEFYYRLYLGEVVYPQSYSGDIVKLCQPDKKDMDSKRKNQKKSNAQVNKSKPARQAVIAPVRRTGPPKPVQPKKALVVTPKQPVPPPSKRKLGKAKPVPNAPPNARFNDDYGARLGSVVGEGLQSFANWLGVGDYVVRKNSMMGQMYLSPGGPKVRRNVDGSISLRHCEYFGEMLSGGAGEVVPSPFTSKSYALTPTNSALFPWLSQWAGQFQEFTFDGVIVEIRSETSEYTQNSLLGSIFAVVDYDSSTKVYSDKMSVLDSFWGVSTKPSLNLIAPLECSSSESPDIHKYVPANGVVPAGYDPRLYSLGNLWLGSYGLPVSGAPVGEMWIHYDITLYKPVLNPSAGVTCFHAVASFAGGSSPKYVTLPLDPLSKDCIDSFTFAADGSAVLMSLVLDSKVAGRFMCFVHFKTSDSAQAGGAPEISFTGMSEAPNATNTANNWFMGNPANPALAAVSTVTGYSLNTGDGYYHAFYVSVFDLSGGEAIGEGATFGAYSPVSSLSSNIGTSIEVFFTPLSPVIF